MANRPRHGYDPPEALSNPPNSGSTPSSCALPMPGRRSISGLPQGGRRRLIWEQATRSGRAPTGTGIEPESVNAQGISRTEGILACACRREADPATRPGASGRAQPGQRVAAFADLAWVAASGAFTRSTIRPPSTFPTREAMFWNGLRSALASGERSNHGKWIYGDLPSGTFSSKGAQTPDFYCAYMGTHHGWPYPGCPTRVVAIPAYGAWPIPGLFKWSTSTIAITPARRVETRIGQDRYRRWGWLPASRWFQGPDMPTPRPDACLRRPITCFTPGIWPAGSRPGHPARLGGTDQKSRNRCRRTRSDRRGTRLGRSVSGVPRNVGGDPTPGAPGRRPCTGEMHLARWRAELGAPFLPDRRPRFHRFTGRRGLHAPFLDYAAAWGGHANPTRGCAHGRSLGTSPTTGLAADRRRLSPRPLGLLCRCAQKRQSTPRRAWYPRVYTWWRVCKPSTGWALEYFPSALATSRRFGTPSTAASSPIRRNPSGRNLAILPGRRRTPRCRCACPPCCANLAQRRPGCPLPRLTRPATRFWRARVAMEQPSIEVPALRRLVRSGSRSSSTRIADWKCWFRHHRARPR